MARRGAARHEAHTPLPRPHRPPGAALPCAHLPLPSPRLPPLLQRALQPNVHHLRCLAEAAGDRIEALAAGRPVELLCCDANKHAAQGLPMVAPLLRLLRPGGLLVLTLKLRGRGRDRSQWQAEAEGALCPLGCDPPTLLWLLANTVCERTCVARKAGAPAAAAPVV